MMLSTYAEPQATAVPATAPLAGLKEMDQLNDISTETNYARGALLFAEDEMPKAVFVLCSGRVKLSITSREGKTAILRIAGPGEVLGLSSVMAGTCHETSAEVIEPCRIKVVHARDFLMLLEKCPEVAKATTHILLDQYRTTFGNVCRLALPATVAGRMANLLLGWTNEHPQKDKKEIRITLALTHEEIAGMANTSRETVSRVLSQFQKEKLIAIKGASVTILQPTALQQLAL